MGMRTPMSGTRIELWSGNYLDLEDPAKSTITREDVIVGLSNTCRCAGQTRRYYSVAEHSVLVADLVAYLGGHRGHQRAALLHDASEAFLHDLTAPLKLVLRRQFAAGAVWHYDKITEALDWRLSELFGHYVTDLNDQVIQVADQWAFVIEAGALLASQGVGYAVPANVRLKGGLPPGVAWHAGLEPIQARLLYRARWEALDA